MNPTTPILLAQRSHMDSLGNSFRSHGNAPSDVVLGLLILAALVLGIWALARLLAIRERRRSFDSPRRLFLSLCRAHQLSWRDRWLLWRVAKVQKLKDPARLFLEPERFEAARLGPALTAKTPRLAALREQLFLRKARSEPAKPAPARRPAPQATILPPSLPSLSPLPPLPPLPAARGPSLDIAPWPAQNER